MSNHSRRAVLAGIAAIPVAALPAIALASPSTLAPTPATPAPLALAAAPSAAHPDAGLFELEKKILAAEREANKIAKSHTRVEKTMFAWRKDNPRPVQRKCSFPFAGSPRSIDEVGAVISYDDYHAAKREHEEAMRQWEPLEEEAKKNCRFDEMEAEYSTAVDKVTRLYNKAAKTKALTLDGLKCKARLYRRDECDQESFGEFIARDLLALKAVS